MENDSVFRCRVGLPEYRTAVTRRETFAKGAQGGDAQPLDIRPFLGRQKDVYNTRVYIRTYKQYGRTYIKVKGVAYRTPPTRARNGRGLDNSGARASRARPLRQWE